MNHSKSRLEKTAFWVNIATFIFATGLPVIFALFIGKISFAFMGLIGLLALVNIKLMKSHSKWAREFLLGAPLLVATLVGIITSNDSGLGSFLEIFILSYLLFFLPGLLAYLVYRKNEVPQMAIYKSPVLILVGILLASTVGKTFVDKQYQVYLANQPPVFQKTDSNNDFERWIAFEGGFYDSKLNDYIIPPQFEEVQAFSEGLAAVKIKSKWGFINSDAELVIPAKYDNYGTPEDFKNGRAIVHGSSEALLIDKTGKTIARVSGHIDRNKSHKFRILKNNTLVRMLTGYIDSTNFNIIKTKFFNELGDFSSNGLAAVEISKGKYGYIDETGKVVIDPKFDRAEKFSAVGLAFAKLGKEHGYINDKGEFVLKPSFAYKDLGDFSDNGLAAFEGNHGKWGFFDKKGKIAIQPKYDRVEQFSQEGFSIVVMNKKRGVIDSKGNVIIPFKFDKFEYLTFFPKKGYAQVKDGYVTKGYIETNGNWIVYKGSLCDQNVVINANEKVIWPKGFDESCNNQSAANSLKYVPSDSSKTVDSAPKYSKSRNEKSPFEIALQKINNQAPRHPLLIDSSTKRDYVSKGGIVIDRDNNLMWSRCAHGQGWNGKTCSGEALEVTWEQAVDIAKSSTLGNFHDWRLPTIKELQTLIYCSNGKRIQYDGVRDLRDEGIGCIVRNSRALEGTPTIDISQFINHLGYGYWSSTTLPANAYSVLFDEGKGIFMRGTTYLTGRKYADNVRLVRSGHDSL